MICIVRKLALIASVGLLAGCGSFSIEGSTPAYTEYSPTTTIAQMPSRCHVRGSGIYVLPDPTCTPGKTNPAVTPATIRSTICRSGWTRTVRPPSRITEPEKYGSMAAYGYPRSAARSLEYDHLIPLELGGAPNDPRNLWPEVDYAHPRGYDHNPKDVLEYRLRGLVCGGKMPLAQAQKLVATNWVAAYRRYVP